MRHQLRIFAVATLAAASCNSSRAVTSGEPQAQSAGDPPALATRLVELNDCQSRLQETHATYPAQKMQAEGGPPILYVYYNLDERLIHNPFVEHVDGFNDECELHANDAIGAVRGVLEPKPGAVVDAGDPRSLVDLFTDVCGLRVINNESGWYEGWLIHDLTIPSVRAARSDGHAPFGHITQADADLLRAMGAGHNVPGKTFTTDGGEVGIQVKQNTVAIPVSLGAWNTLQGEDGHAYWELNEYTNFSFPFYELLGTGGMPGSYDAGEQYGPLGDVGPNVDSRVPGSGPRGRLNNNSIAGKVEFGDDPDRPRDPDRDPETCGGEEGEEGGEEEEMTQAETRLRFVPSGLATEIMRDVYLRRASFQPATTDLRRRVLDAYAFEVGRLDENEDGVLQFHEVDIEDESDGLPNTRLFLAPNRFNRVAITREINDGLLAPRFAPTQKAYVLAGKGAFVSD